MHTAAEPTRIHRLHAAKRETMKQINRLLILLSALLLLCLCACRNKSYPHAMQVADTLVYNHPDSALALLSQLEDSIDTAPEATQMYYRLLCIKAQDKAYITHTSDSLILQVIRYYEGKNDRKHLPEAYYYGGRVYADLGDAPQALDYYQKAAELLEGGTDHRLMVVVYSQMGELFLFQGVYEEAMKAYKQAYRYSALTQDDRSMIVNLYDIGTTWMAFDKPDSVKYYYILAQTQAENSKDKQLITMMHYCLIDLYTQLKQYDLAEATLKNTPPQGTAQYSIVAALYHEMGKLDSAQHYYNIMLKSDNIYVQQGAHWGLAKIAEKNLDCSTAIHHLQVYTELTDSIKTITDSESIRKMQSLYNYQLREKENKQLKDQAIHHQFWILSSLLILCVLALVFITYFYTNKQKKVRLENSLKELKRQKEEQYQRSTSFIEENKLKIKELEEQLQTNNQNHTNMQRLLHAQKEQILRMNCKIEAEQKEQALAEIAFHQSDIYNKFREAANNTTTILNSKDWEILRIKIDRCYKDFTARLQAIYPVSDMEMKICLLIKIGINVTGIALLTGRSKSAIVSARKKLYEKTHGEAGKPELWDKIIQSL